MCLYQESIVVLLNIQTHFPICTGCAEIRIMVTCKQTFIPSGRTEYQATHSARLRRTSTFERKPSKRYPSRRHSTFKGSAVFVLSLHFTAQLSGLAPRGWLQQPEGALAAVLLCRPETFQRGPGLFSWWGSGLLLSCRL